METAAGPVGSPLPVNSDLAGSPPPTDTTVGDFDDILMLPPAPRAGRS